LLDLVKNSENGTISSENENSNLKLSDQLYTSGFKRELLGSLKKFTRLLNLIWAFRKIYLYLFYKAKIFLARAKFFLF
jgi:hypothetical protein